MNSILRQRIVFATVMLLAIPACLDCGAQPPAPTARQASSLEQRLEAVRAKYDVPALFAGRFTADDQLILATGLRRADAEVRVTVDDTLHLGSCTKAMTAVLVGQEITAQRLAWTSSLEEVFPDVPGLAGSVWATVTVEQLLRHSSGAPANAPWSTLHARHPNDPLRSRRALLNWLIEQPRDAEVGYVYSNVGYALLGHMVETCHQTAWEDVIQEQLFAPLNIRFAGFGPVVGPEELDQPWGHVPIDPPNSPKGDSSSAAAEINFKPTRIDNPPPLGPAGRVHMPLTEWAKFVRVFATTAAPPDSLQISAHDWQRLMSLGEEGAYAAGWIQVERKWADGLALTHAGSNTTWYCVAWVAPSLQTYYLAATNCGGEAAAKACDEAVVELLNY